MKRKDLKLDTQLINFLRKKVEINYNEHQKIKQIPIKIYSSNPSPHKRNKSNVSIQTNLSFISKSIEKRNRSNNCISPYPMKQNFVLDKVDDSNQLNLPLLKDQEKENAETIEASNKKNESPCPKFENNFIQQKFNEANIKSMKLSALQSTKYQKKLMNSNSASCFNSQIPNLMSNDNIINTECLNIKNSEKYKTMLNDKKNIIPEKRLPKIYIKDWSYIQRNSIDNFQNNICFHPSKNYNVYSQICTNNNFFTNKDKNYLKVNNIKILKRFKDKENNYYKEGIFNSGDILNKIGDRIYGSVADLCDNIKSS